MFLLPLGSSCVNIFVNIVFWIFFRCSFFLHVQALSIGGTVTKRCRTQRDSLTWNCGGFFQYGTFYRNKVCIFSQKKHRVCDACGFPWKTEVFFHSRLLLLIIQVTHDHLFSFRWKRVAIFAPRPHTAHVNWLGQHSGRCVAFCETKQLPLFDCDFLRGLLSSPWSQQYTHP